MSEQATDAVSPLASQPCQEIWPWGFVATPAQRAVGRESAAGLFVLNL